MWCAEPTTQFDWPPTSGSNGSTIRGEQGAGEGVVQLRPVTEVSHATMRAWWPMIPTATSPRSVESYGTGWAGPNPTIIELLAGAKRVTGVVSLGSQATQAAADQLEVVARRARRWLDAHPARTRPSVPSSPKHSTGSRRWPKSVPRPPGASLATARRTSTRRLPWPPCSLCRPCMRSGQGE